MIKKILFTFSILAVTACGMNVKKVDVLVVGGGASGTAAAIQAARGGADVVLAEEGPWLGGMLTSAGVSAIDGNYRLRGGIFGEFTDSLAARYGGYDALRTGWVSNILFEPHVGAEIFANMTAEAGVKVLFNTSFVSAEPLRTGACKFAGPDSKSGICKSKGKGGWKVTLLSEGRKKVYKVRILIDGTELGDVAKHCGVEYEIGTPAVTLTTTGKLRPTLPEERVVQDLTMVMTVRFEEGDHRIPMPEGYDRSLYENSCINPWNHPSDKGQVLLEPERMLSYGQLPNGYIMINWPTEGNDFYANIVDATPEERAEVIAKAKQKTLGFLYFLQNEVGLTNLALVREYPTEDGLPMIPYHRESRRIKGEWQFSEDEAKNPFINDGYRTGVAVGDYPIDHHHYQRADWKTLPKSCGPIPSFTLPLGVIIPKDVNNLLVIEKSISVTSMANGTTRLQPVVMEIGQVAGLVASMVVSGDVRTAAGEDVEMGAKTFDDVREIPVREVQRRLLAAGARIQPFLDLKPEEDGFLELQRIGSTGILRGEGRCVAWNNETWFRTDDPLRWCDLYLSAYYGIPYNPSEECVTAAEFAELIQRCNAASRACKDGQSSGQSKCGAGSKSEKMGECGEQVEGEFQFDRSAPTVSRLQAAMMIDHCLDPFNRYDVDIRGAIIR